MEYDGLNRRLVETVGDADANNCEVGDREATYQTAFRRWKRANAAGVRAPGERVTARQHRFPHIWLEQFDEDWLDDDDQSLK